MRQCSVGVGQARVSVQAHVRAADVKVRQHRAGAKTDGLQTGINAKDAHGAMLR